MKYFISITWLVALLTFLISSATLITTPSLTSFCFSVTSFVVLCVLGLVWTSYAIKQDCAVIERLKEKGLN